MERGRQIRGTGRRPGRALCAVGDLSHRLPNRGRRRRYHPAATELALLLHNGLEDGLLAASELDALALQLLERSVDVCLAHLLPAPVLLLLRLFLSLRSVASFRAMTPRSNPNRAVSLVGSTV